MLGPELCLLLDFPETRSAKVVGILRWQEESRCSRWRACRVVEEQRLG